MATTENDRVDVGPFDRREATEGDAVVLQSCAV
jgi:hypothetical protein